MSSYCMIIGCRPDIIKLGPLILEMQRRGMELEVWHVGQHYSPQMDQVFQEHYGIEGHVTRLIPNAQVPEHPSEFFQLAFRRVAEKLWKVGKGARVIVYGDTLGAMAAAVAAKEERLELIHIEAGLRSFDTCMPEEMARITMDALADHLFCPTDIAFNQLEREGVRGQRLLTGNLIVDALAFVGTKDLPSFGSDPYIALTLHRPENVDDLEKFITVLSWVGMQAAQRRIRVIYPVHPRAIKWMEQIPEWHHYEILGPLKPYLPYIEGINPLTYPEMVGLLKKAEFIVTDSGGIQEEAAILEKKCITLRRNTERQETCIWGWNLLIDVDRAWTDINRMVHRHLETPARMKHMYGRDVARGMAEALEKR